MNKNLNISELIEILKNKTNYTVLVIYNKN